MPQPSPQDVPASLGIPTALARDGRPLETAEDVADFLGMPRRHLIHALYKAPESTKYAVFEIPKRGGGMRRISAPRGVVREAQDRLLPALRSLYDAHPNAHGFVTGRSVVSNARLHVDRRWVLNVDLEDFFPSINFGRVRGLLMKPPFGLGAPAAAVVAQICTYRNGLPQGAPTSPVLSNFIATALDRRLLRLARDNRMQYSRYADDITFSTNAPAFPPNVATFERSSDGQLRVTVGEPLESAITSCGFAINRRKVRIQDHNRHQSVTGLCVNAFANVERERIRRLRAMLHAWDKFGLAAAGREHFDKHGHAASPRQLADVGSAYRQVVYGHLAFVKMVRGADNAIFLKLCARLMTLDPNPSRFVRQMVFGADDFDVFISHASEDKASIARPIYEACGRMGVKAFLDEEHIAWGQSFATKINSALGSARTVLAIVSPTSVGKEWPVAEVNTALSLEVSGHKTVVTVLVGRPDLSRLPLIAGKDYHVWDGDADAVARKLGDAVRGIPVLKAAHAQAAAVTPGAASVPAVGQRPSPAAKGNDGDKPGKPRSWLDRLRRPW